MLDMVGNPEDWFSRVMAHIQSQSHYFLNIEYKYNILQSKHVGVTSMLLTVMN